MALTAFGVHLCGGLFGRHPLSRPQQGQIVKKVVYIAIGVNLDGRKDVLEMWIGENESAKFWATVLNSLKNRGVEDIFIACTDNF